MKRSIPFVLCLLVAAGAAFAQAPQSQPEARAPQSQPAPAAKPAEGAWMKSVALKTEDTLVVYVDPGRILVTPSDKKEMVIKVQGLPKEELGRVQLTTKDNVIKLDYRGVKTMVGTFVIQVPATFNLDSYSTGDVEVQGALNGKIRVRTAEGSINMGNVTGTLTIDSTAGDVYVGDIQGDGEISTNGDLEVENVTGNLDAKNRSGDTFIKSVTGNLDAKAADGDVSVGEVGGNATVLAGIGDVDLRKVGGVATLNTQGGDIDMFEVTGMVVASSNSGEITLRKVSGAADARTEDGDITAEMYSGAGGSSKFYTRDGDVSVYFPDGARATVDAKFRLEGGTAQGEAAEEADDVITSDWPSVNSAKQGGDMINKYEVNGGGDAVLLETVNGEILIKKLAPKPAPQKQN